MTLMDTDRSKEAGLRLAGQAGDAFSNPFTSKLADSPVSESLTRSASGPALAAVPPMVDDGGLIADGAKLFPSSATGDALVAGLPRLLPQLSPFGLPEVGSPAQSHAPVVSALDAF